MDNIQLLTKEADEEYYAFLDALSKTEMSVLGYHYPFYRDMLVRTDMGEPHYLGLREAGQLKAVLPGFVKKSPYGKVYSSLPFFGPNAGVLCAAENREAHTKTLVAFLLDYLAGEDFISASIYSPFLVDKTLYEEVLSPDFPVRIDKFTNYIEMENLAISSKIRYDIRKAEKAGVQITREVTPQKVEDLYAIYLQNCADFSIPIKPRSCIDALVATAANNEQVTFYFAELDGEIIGALIMIWSQSVASYYLPCSLNEHRTLQPNTLLINAALEHAVEKGIKIWNWESSPTKESGVYKFKKKWGSVDGEYNIHVKPFKDRQFFKDLGQENIMAAFPHYFVFPFNTLQDPS